jgi:hypothetical protein
VLRALQARLGPTAQHRVRVRQALDVVQRLETRPMATSARVLTGAVYAALLVVPVAWLVAMGYGSGFGASGDVEEFAADYAREEAAARALPLAELLRDPGSDAPLPQGAGEPALRAVAERLGRTLPDELRALYAVADGAPAAGLHALDRIVPAGDALGVFAAEPAAPVLIELGDTWVEVPQQDTRDWWLIGGDEEIPLLFLPTPHPLLPGITVIEYDPESPRGFASLKDWLAARRASLSTSEQIQREHALRVQAAREDLRDADLDTLIAALHRQPDAPIAWLARWLSPRLNPPPGADPATLEAAAQRLGMALPTELVEVLRIHDGVPRVRLLPAAQLRRWRDVEGLQAAVLAGLPASLAPESADGREGERPLGALQAEDLADCRVVAAVLPPPDAATSYRGYASLVWCADDQPVSGWIDLDRGVHHPRLRDWLLQHAALAQAVVDR